MNWKNHVENNTGEVAVHIVAESLGMDEKEVNSYADENHGRRYVGGSSRYLMWKEDAAALESTINLSLG